MIDQVNQRIDRFALRLPSTSRLFAASTFKINAEMGLLTTLAIVVALIVDFLLLPPILMIGYRQRENVEIER